MREPTNENVPEPGRVTPGAPDWDHISPMLDEVMHQLSETDREAILLRYFENRQFAEVGAEVGLNENAARMRVERALEKLRGFLARRGATTATTLASTISANAVQLAPANLAATLTTASIAGAGTGTFTLLKIMTLTKLKLGLSALVIAGATTALVVQHQTQEKLRAENGSLTQQLAQLEADNESLSNRLAVVGDSKKLPAEQFNELLRLRGEVGALRSQNNEFKNSLAQTKSFQSQRTSPNEQQQTPADLPENYPKTPDAAAARIFKVLEQGNWEEFITNYAEPGEPSNTYASMFTDERKSNLAGMEIISIGQPTNWLSTPSVNKWFVPYEIRFKDGSIKSHRLSVGQDAATQRFFFDGGW
jgi:hypothetical protein